MKIIVGLGNPGKKFKDTRHNVGFNVVDEIASQNTIEKEESKFDAIIGHIRINNEKIFLVKPLTYMNLSGRTVQPLVHYYKCELKDLMVIYDDMDLPVGSLRIREKGGTGGHKGMTSIINRLGSRDFPRMRIGIGRSEQIETTNWVLGQFTKEEKPYIDEIINLAADAATKWVKDGIHLTMNSYNK
ncbi:Peptidyl-tRNA hydrolase [Candidatus Syntrophocurvum alkaliphilum]|uniref:Peptidyl-tRNA hydrolase n=1 Tax=Candidatus Syntrophocurvum alkaliphilum TaxID=2293317 RepID=A0A6I6DIM6_9FIRM|nr:aminoacyl-tRNA hydrolase [Candidatus Syntrophocurvum alkaliphilum]QGU00539.1 Peptidyl-tRNA hydrolase [Candidatus Syntrophocurvum alkaliphilum]